MPIRRVAILFDNTLRPETTGLYCRRALGCLVDVEHFLPQDLGSLARGDHGAFDLYLLVDDGLDWPVPDALRPRACWAIDTHLNPERILRRAADCDFVFAAQQPGVELLRDGGAPVLDWLPLACDLELHGRRPVSAEHDLAFIGSVPPGSARANLLEQLQQRFPGMFVGRRYFEQMAAVWSASRIAFNRSINGDLNMRVFEAMAAGALLLTDDLPAGGLTELFGNNRQLVTYGDADELLERADWYLRHDDRRREIAAAGMREVLERHTYLHRMSRLLDACESAMSTGVAVGTRLSLPPDGKSVPAATEPVDTSAAVAAETDRPERATKTVSRPDVSACLVSWRRPENVRRIVAHLRQQPFIDDIVIWNNDPSIRLEFDDPDVTVIDSPANRVTLGRYLAVASARHETIYTQDDDCLVHNIFGLYEAFQRDPSGITHALRPGHLARNADNLHAVTEEQTAQTALVGWGGFFHRDLVGVLDGYRQRFGEDRLLERKADRLFSLLAGCRHRSRPADITDLPGCDGPEALSVRDDHQRLTREAVLRGLTLLHESRFAQEQSANDVVAASVGVTDVGTSDEGTTDSPVEGDIQQSRGTAAATTAPGSRRVHDAAYHDWPRPEVVALVPETARRVLDLGCGTGRLGEALRQRGQVQVTGVELDAGAADIARSRLDAVHCGDLNDPALDFPAGSFDCVICADILEHLPDPAAVLGRIRRWLEPQGRLVLSLPNVQHHSVLTALLDGSFTYEPAGLLDDTHLRHFTRREMEKLLFRAGFRIDSRHSVPGPQDHDWWRQHRANGHAPCEVSLGSLRITGLAPGRAEEFLTYQYLLTATPQPAPRDGLTSIVLVTFNQRELTRGCIESIRFRTNEPFELIVVDNGSTDGTVEWLRGCPDVRLIENDTNRGFPAAANQGLRAARGDRLLLLNNDTLVTTGWLRRLLDALDSAPDVGLAGPCSNRVSGPQQIPVSYRQLSQLDGFAWDHAARHAAQRIDADRLVGFCLLFRREVLNQVGLLDERFGIGNFEDDDFCRRAAQSGWRAVIAADAFVHHFGSATFRAAGIDLRQLLEHNHRLYDEKWQPEDGAGATTPAGESPLETGAVDTPPPVAVEPITPEPASAATAEQTLRNALQAAAASSPAAAPNGRPVTLSLCMIVRDNEHTIRPCLESIRPWVDEMIVVDTGSTDRTPDICRELGARVFHFPWCDSFSAARNESLRHATGEWLFWMDSDDTIPADCGRQLRELARQTHPADRLGFVCQVHCPGEQPHEVTVVDHVKLFRNRPDLRFEFHIHEQILPAIRRAGGDVAFTEIHVVHSGADRTTAGRARKLERDFRLLELDRRAQPDHPFVLFNLGMTYNDAGRHEEAIACLIRCVEVSGPGESHLRKARSLLIGSQLALRQYDAAERSCREALAQFPDDRELLFRQALAAQHTGRLEQAAEHYRRVIEGTEDRHFASVDASLHDIKARHNLALVLEDQQRPAEAEAEWRRILELSPAYGPAMEGLGRLLIAGHRLDEADALAARLDGSPDAGTAAVLLSSRIAAARGDFAVARDVLESAWTADPDQSDILRELCRLLFERFGPEAARPWLEKLTRHDPRDAAAWHNLGAACLQDGDGETAIRALATSLELRPDSPDTRQLLEQALKQLPVSAS